MASKIVDKIDPFQNKALIKNRKQKRSQGSSHYRTQGTSELQALPQLKGKKWFKGPYIISFILSLLIPINLLYFLILTLNTHMHAHITTL